MMIIQTNKNRLKNRLHLLNAKSFFLKSVEIFFKYSFRYLYKIIEMYIFKYFVYDWKKLLVGELDKKN